MIHASGNRTQSSIIPCKKRLNVPWLVRKAGLDLGWNPQIRQKTEDSIDDTRSSMGIVSSSGLDTPKLPSKLEESGRCSHLPECTGPQLQSAWECMTHSQNLTRENQQ